MSTLWSAATQVTTGLTLVAFTLAVAAWVYRTTLLRKERLILTAAEADRARLVENALEFFHVDTKGLTRDQKYQLALEQIRARERRFLATSRVVSLAAVLLTGVSAYAVARTTGGLPKQNECVNGNAPFHELDWERAAVNRHANSLVFGCNTQFRASAHSVNEGDYSCMLRFHNDGTNELIDSLTILPRLTKRKEIRLSGDDERSRIVEVDTIFGNTCRVRVFGSRRL